MKIGDKVLDIDPQGFRFWKEFLEDVPGTIIDVDESTVSVEFHFPFGDEESYVDVYDLEYNNLHIIFEKEFKRLRIKQMLK